MLRSEFLTKRALKFVADFEPFMLFSFGFPSQYYCNRKLDFFTLITIFNN